MTSVTEADTDEHADSGTEERPEDGVEDWPPIYISRQHGARVDVPRVVHTADGPAMSVSGAVQLTTEVLDSFSIPQRVARTLLQRALQHTPITQLIQFGFLNHQRKEYKLGPTARSTIEWLVEVQHRK